MSMLKELTVVAIVYAIVVLLIVWSFKTESITGSTYLMTAGVFGCLGLTGYSVYVFSKSPK